MKKVILICIVLLSGCVPKDQTDFSKKALEDRVIALDGTSVSFEEVLAKYKGKKIVINAWASWCSDCIVSLPNIKQMQKENPEIPFVFLSLDKSVRKWKKGIDRFHVQGNHYFMEKGWDSDLSKFLSLRWIPRYVIINEKGKIEVFNKTKLTRALFNKHKK
ncbi:TlpA family protein disulfide reductase [Tenacibaculum maritimum]|uniref:TlpA family protein disulfide reductase n=1 Tax=Tenacibaculum maritimum TaxID=107401 RepID=UPI001E5F81DE|nr:TlpA disulfide reductase family protein [Tenacibaculum maritimum]MCD9564098.1 TlpA family protein disulfide reductase [Tenacibaculum maritimum]MCD9566560.1 TlpA family protein disulfide reductase [Tenacibaculum maritimum]MCD9579609.1 TlpA family protein disulfide reductase [Tenacibaculum maritimum]MCD9596987.1 TlpA family protein disulfide reductase [Tenacibaculum maritimum]MCD9614127.1 TlpA family protein disulfide reductase [Tenacibaculum maritimum]